MTTDRITTPQRVSPVYLDGALGALAGVLLLVFMLLLIGACGDPQTVAAKSLSGAQQTLIGLKTGLVDYDKAHQDAIIDGAPNRAAALEQLAAYRVVRGKIVVGLLAAQQLLVTAQSALMLVQAGIADISTIGGPIADLLAAVTKLALDFALLKMPAPPAAPPLSLLEDSLHFATNDLWCASMPQPLPFIVNAAVAHLGGL